MEVDEGVGAYSRMWLERYNVDKGARDAFMRESEEIRENIRRMGGLGQGNTSAILMKRLRVARGLRPRGVTVAPPGGPEQVQKQSTKQDHEQVHEAGPRAGPRSRTTSRSTSRSTNRREAGGAHSFAEEAVVTHRTGGNATVLPYKGYGKGGDLGRPIQGILPVESDAARHAPERMRAAVARACPGMELYTCDGRDMIMIYPEPAFAYPTNADIDALFGRGKQAYFTAPETAFWDGARDIRKMAKNGKTLHALWKKVATGRNGGQAQSKKFSTASCTASIGKIRITS
jgi:hypothetical protein